MIIETSMRDFRADAIAVVYHPEPSVVDIQIGGTTGDWRARTRHNSCNNGPNTRLCVLNFSTTHVEGLSHNCDRPERDARRGGMNTMEVLASMMPSSPIPLRDMWNVAIVLDGPNGSLDFVMRAEVFGEDDSIVHVEAPEAEAAFDLYREWDQIEDDAFLSGISYADFLERWKAGAWQATEWVRS